MMKVVTSKDTLDIYCLDNNKVIATSPRLGFNHKTVALKNVGYMIAAGDWVHRPDKQDWTVTVVKERNTGGEKDSISKPEGPATIRCQLPETIEQAQTKHRHLHPNR